MSARPQISGPLGPPAPPPPVPAPPHCTPPRTHRYRIKNPFERTLVDSLSSPMCSPGMFKIRESSGSFKWDIEQVSVLKPADIVACNSQFHQSPDPVLEKKATEAIEKFFSQEMIVPSPLDEVPKRIVLAIKEKVISTPDSNKCNVWTQTGLSFPTTLPSETENALRPFYSFKKDQNTCDVDMSANASLRRKLCFEEVCSDEEEDESFVADAFVSRGVKRSLNSSHSSISCSLDANMETRSLILQNQPTSPILGFEAQQERCAFGEAMQHLKSPSLSPIRKSDADKICARKSADISYNREYDTSFSQSTPEKSDRIDLTTDYSPTEANLFKHKFQDSFNQYGKNYSKFTQRSLSESSLTEHKNNKSVLKLETKMDISSDTSMHFSKDQSFHGNVGLGSSSDSIFLQSQTQTSNNLNMEFVETNFNIQYSETENRVSKNICISNVVADNTVSKHTSYEEKGAIHFDKYDKFSEVYQYLTPTKNLRNDLPNTFDRSPAKKNWHISYSSPMQVSLENSFNLDADKNPIKEFVQSESDYADKFFDYAHSLSEDAKINIPCNLNKFGETSKNDSEAIFYRMDSGFMDNLYKNSSHSKFYNQTDVTKCNSSKYNSDATKSALCSSDSSGWKRFDSGFHDETSSDFIQQTTINDTHRQLSSKCTPISEYLEDHKELVNFDDFNKFLEHGARAQSSISVSETFHDDMASIIKYNFSSTPSKNQHVK